MKNLILLLVLFLTVISCKKEEIVPSPPAPVVENYTYVGSNWQLDSSVVFDNGYQISTLDTTGISWHITADTIRYFHVTPSLAMDSVNSYFTFGQTGLSINNVVYSVNQITANKLRLTRLVSANHPTSKTYYFNR
jgi:hypothetical protein